MSAEAPAQQVIVRSAGTNALSFVLRFAARAGFLWVAARLYGASTYGAFSFAVAVIELAVPIASLGLKRMIFPWLEQEADRHGAAHVLLDALAIGLAGSLLMAVLIMTGTALAPGTAMSAELRLALIALAPALAGQVVADTAFAATRWTHAMRFEVAGRGAIEPYVGTAVAAAAYGAGWTASGLLLSYGAGSVALAAYALVSAWRTFDGFDMRHWRPHPERLLARSQSLLTASGSDALTALAQRADLYLVGLLLGDKATGIYGVIRQLRTPVLQVRQAFDGILTPVIARSLSHIGEVETGNATAAATRVILAAQLPVVILMVTAGDALLRLFGPQYVSGYGALLALCAAEVLNGAFGIGETIIYYLRPVRALAINLAMIAIPVLLVVPLAPRLGIVAAALAVAMAALVAVWLRRFWLANLGIKSRPLHAAVPILAAAVAAAFGLGLRQEVAPWSPGAGIIVPTLLALIVYGVAIAVWVRLDPDALSLGRFRIG